MVYTVDLNFLAFDSELPAFWVYRRPKAPAEPRPSSYDMGAYSLPRTDEDIEDRMDYWVTLEQQEEFERVQVSPTWNHNLTKWALYHGLQSSSAETLQQQDYKLFSGGFRREVRFRIHGHEEGDEELVVRPYYLRNGAKFGFLADFHFRRKQSVPFSRRIQMLSLSLDRNYRRNLNYYVDRYEKLREFVRIRQDVLRRVRLPGTDVPLDLSVEFRSIEAERLRSKVYVFDKNKESKSQFNGLIDFGPLQPLVAPPTLLFVFREQDRQAARTLAMALRGPRQNNRASFPGFERLFRTELQIDSNPVVVNDFTLDTARKVLERVESSNDKPVPVFVLPDSDSPGYLEQKALFAEKGIATQACTLQVIQDESTLRWSVANIALQLFCKSGGLPWTVRSSDDRALIIGISQSHKVRNDSDQTTIERYFAFSVLTDSSGLFQKIQALGAGSDLGSYLEDLRKNLEHLLWDNVANFSRIVIHTSFRLKMREIEAIRSTVNRVATSLGAQCEFAVVKVNEHNRFFGVNCQTNSLVPFEGTKVRLGPGEYLVWFEGIFPDRQTVNKVFPGPTHIEFLKISGQRKASDLVLLQDLINLSGANWRGFNAKSSPVSVFYCHIIASLVHEFHGQGLPMPAVEQLSPWFL